jgi:hemerythrin-like domain-containing protein
MNTNRQTALALHQEHQANLDLLGRVERALSRVARGAWRSAIAPGSELPKLFAALEHQLGQDVERHFVFEETELFTRMVESGDGSIAALLRDEHEAIRDLAAELLPLAHAAAASALDEAGWTALVRDAFELTERQVSHIQKEEMALLPMLEDLLDDETDRRLAIEYASN